MRGGAHRRAPGVSARVGRCGRGGRHRLCGPMLAARELHPQTRSYVIRCVIRFGDVPRGIIT
jgi:hypothetical protein